MLLPDLQFQASSDWDSLVTAAFHSLDSNGDGKISGEEMERLLCGDDGCEASAAGVARRRAAACSPALPMPLMHSTTPSTADDLINRTAAAAQVPDMVEAALREADADNDGAGGRDRG